MMEEARNKWTLSKENIEWDAVETIPILLYTDNFTLLSVYKKRYKVKCLVFEKITLFWATLCGYNLYSWLKAVTLRQTQQIIEAWRI